MVEVILKDNVTQDTLGKVHVSRVPVANGRETVFFKDEDLLVTSIRMVPLKAQKSKDFNNVRAVVFVKNKKDEGEE